MLFDHFVLLTQMTGSVPNETTFSRATVKRLLGDEPYFGAFVWRVPFRGVSVKK